MDKKILIIEDEEALAKAIAFALTQEGFSVTVATSGITGLRKILKEKFDLLILDLTLPGLSGWQICREVRSESELPILILTARGEEDDRVLGFELGADDYVVKPFSVRELIFRVKALIRRFEKNGPTEDAPVTIGDLALDPKEWTATFKGKPLKLTPKEFALLHILALNAGKVLTRPYLLERVWGYQEFIDLRTVDVHIHWLREKIEDDPSRPKRILTVRGIGYKFAPFSEETSSTPSTKTGDQH